MSKSFKEWLAGVNEHYGDLMHFPDANTIRIMRLGQINILAEHDVISKGIQDDGGRAYYDETFAEDIAEAKANVELMDKWLAQRGLKP
ncbi:hypothetical protein [Mesorhizobium sp.]|uniref:hypothetical protein n=1 Tax=Mesorhizobium sp. TaxID=1871066 RepID=UPI000FE32697|nr:hypothetical protein [Mesorhizobium sp.]RWJ03478.1 MAG: hypothetical protein EOR24_32375 [Mesorhizobium sp.]